jgi:hypothetical protein
LRLRSVLHPLLGFALLYTQSLIAGSDIEKNRKIEEQFIEVVQSFSDKGSARRTVENRKDAMEKALGGFEVRGWLGVITELNQLENGDYAVALVIGEPIVLRTSGVEAEYDSKSALIQAGSPLCIPLSRMKPGQKVAFDGVFLRDKAKGPNKGGLAANWNLEQPEFAFQVTRIKFQRPPPLKTWKQIVEETRNQILTLHQAGGGKVTLLDFARTMGFKIKAETEQMLRDRGDLVFKPTGDNSGEFTNEGPELEIKSNVGHIKVPKLVSGTYTCSDESTVLKFSKNHTFTGKLTLISAPLESITADDKKVEVKIGGVFGGALSRTLPVE